MGKINDYATGTAGPTDKLLASDGGTGETKNLLVSDINVKFQHEIGEYVASEGGVIAHRWLSTSIGGIPTAGTSQNYMVVDTNDLSIGAAYATLNVDIANVESTFNGQVNTQNLIIAGAGNGITVGTAAELCNSSTNNGQTDWYLPSIDELSKLWQNKWDFAQGINLAAGTQISFSAYWSSTEHGVNTAWNFNFNNGDATNGSKGSTYYVRAVRTFGV
jgi:hypothetical protein